MSTVKGYNIFMVNITNIFDIVHYLKFLKHSVLDTESVCVLRWKDRERELGASGIESSS
jgi:hypothetical protein